MICFESVDIDSRVSVPSRCDRSSVLPVCSTLRLNCDATRQLVVQDALSPTQMPPKKRHRRSASVPGGTRSESHIHRYLARHRQSSGVLQPVPIRCDITGIVRPPVLTCLPVVSSGTEDVHPDIVSQPAFRFSGSSLSHVRSSFTKFPLSSFRGTEVPVSTWPLSDCKRESVARPSASSPSVRHEHINVSTDKASLQRGELMTRCHSQPGALLTRSSSLKRRRDEYRPWLDFRKMREVVIILCFLYFSQFCVALTLRVGELTAA